MAELLLELFSEEIPAGMQARAAEDLERVVVERLKAAQLAPETARSFVTPRRLALVATGLPVQQADVTEDRRGPRVGAPDNAIQGFLKANGLASLDQCEKRDTGKGEFWFAIVRRSGQPTAAVLSGLLAEAIAALPWQKSMRWGAGAMRWVRPLQRILCLFDGNTVPIALANPVPVGDATAGHRFMAPAPIAVSAFDDYAAKLRAAHVVLDAEERKRLILERAGALARSAGLALRDDPGLVAEVAGLVEWPVVLMGTIDPAFMEVPPEVLITAMRTHQRYFATLDSAGRLANRFVVVANRETADGGAAVVAGNERVLRARLSDARFFWDQDRKRPLESRVSALADMVFHAKLGTIAAKVVRLQALAAELAPHVPGADIDQVRSAATLCKADLTAGMVGEFPELQGVMGRYYAHHEGEKDAVADAIAEHYSPAGPNDRCPTAPVSVAVALADKIDSLVGFFAIGEKPTGSRDPFALRRAALGIIRLVIENRLRLPLREAFRRAYWGYNEAVAGFEKGLEKGHRPKVLERELLDFFADRLKVHLRGEGVRHDLIGAVFALGDEDDLVRLLARVEALRAFVATDDGANLLIAYRRAANIVAIEEKKDGVRHDGDPSESDLAEAEERALYAALGTARATRDAALGREDFAVAMTALAGLRRPVDSFFDKVLVNAEVPDLRRNRLRLLSRIRSTMNGMADFSQIEG
ncbi:MAG: glycine--tRNA ligase subunit beta [Alphaproteobacteria bacterium]|nr:glycine--tRNA ligase subunit beta [Alphaproteobacteria bacterium]